MHFYAWGQKLKTGIYYLRSKAAVDAKKFTLEVAPVREEEPELSPEEFRQMVEAGRNAGEDDCEMCGS
jgi:ribonucleoside-diphosphate reductase alpha chain